MVLEKQRVLLPFRGGVDTKTDAKVVQPGKLTLLENGSFVSPGEISKRKGFDDLEVAPLDATRELDEGASMFRRGEECSIIARQETIAGALTDEDDGWQAYSLLDQGSASGNLIPVGRVDPLRLQVHQVGGEDSSAETRDPTVDAINGYELYVWQPVGSQHYALMRETSTGFVPLGRTQLFGVAVPGCSPRVVRQSVGGTSYFVVLAGNGAGGTIIHQDIKAEPGVSFSAPIAIKNDFHAGNLIDACRVSVGGSDQFVVAYKETAAGQIHVSRFLRDGTHVLTRTIAHVPKNVISCELCFDYNEVDFYVVVCFQSNVDGNIYSAVYDQSLTLIWGPSSITATTAAETVRNITSAADPSADPTPSSVSSFRTYVEVQATAGAAFPWYNYVRQVATYFASATSTDHHLMPRCGLASRAYSYQNKARVWVVQDTTQQRTYFLVSSDGTNVVTEAKALYTSAGAVRSLPGLSNVATPAGDRKMFAGLKAVQSVIDNAGVGYTVYDTVGIDVDYNRQACQHADQGPTSQIASGGILGSFDELNFRETGYHLYPEKITGVSANTGGSMAAGDYNYKLVYEWSDAKGQVIRSRPSPAVTVTVAVAPDDSATLTLPYLPFTEPALGTRINLVVYRTQVGPGTTYTRVRSVLNDPLLNFVLLTDQLSDAQIVGNTPIYTTGDGDFGTEELGNIGPPGTRIVTARRDRVFVVPEDDRVAIWPSKIKSAGVGLEFNDLLALRFPQGGEITGLAEIGSRVYIFKQDEIRAFGGAGPNNNGVGSWTPDEQVSSNIGCVDSQSIVQAAGIGVFFKSRAGIYQLSRGDRLAYVGAAVEEFNVSTVLRGEHVQGQNLVRFLLDGNKILEYDYLVGQWSTSLSHTDAADICAAGGDFNLLRSTGAMLREGTGFDDAGTDYALKLDTAWINRGDLLGYQRIWWAYLLGEYKSAHTLNVEVFYDYVDTAAETFTVALTSDPSPYLFRFQPARQRCSAIKVRVYDSAQAGTSEAYTITGLEFIVGTKSKTPVRASKSR
jgi:hypothetical protein